VSSLLLKRGRHCAGREGEACADRPGSESGAKVWDGFSRNLGDPVYEQLPIAGGAAAGAGPGLRGCLRRMGANEETRSCSGETKIISDPVIGAGSRSALIVLRRLGNAARADPEEGSGAPLYRIAFEKHGGRFEA
jgi:hypothetical protein